VWVGAVDGRSKVFVLGGVWVEWDGAVRKYSRRLCWLIVG